VMADTLVAGSDWHGMYSVALCEEWRQRTRRKPKRRRPDCAKFRLVAGTLETHHH
jgi:hypothetical protein